MSQLPTEPTLPPRRTSHGRNRSPVRSSAWRRFPGRPDPLDKRSAAMPPPADAPEYVGEADDVGAIRASDPVHERRTLFGPSKGDGRGALQRIAYVGKRTLTLGSDLILLTLAAPFFLVFFVIRGIRRRFLGHGDSV